MASKSGSEDGHNLEKHIIHLKEGCDAIIQTVKAIQRTHNKLCQASNYGRPAPHPAIPATEKNLDYILGSFQSLNLRIKSIDARVKNAINLVRRPKSLAQ